LLLEETDRIAKIMKTLMREKRIRLASHFDADGLTSAAIIMKMAMRLGVDFKLSVHKQLTSDVVEKLKSELKSGDMLVLSDFGSGQLNQLKPVLDSIPVVVLDHHEPLRMEHPNLLHLNPLLFSDEEISASMVCYMLAKAVDVENSDLIDLAILGAVGDMQDENWRFEGTARKLLEEAELLGKISVTRGLRLFGRNTRPLHKALEYSFDPMIPGIAGSESHAVQFLSDLDIDVHSDDGWKRLCDLTEDEQKVLTSAIIMQRLKFDSDDAGDIFGEIYNLVGKPLELQDAREFATLLNACGRTGNVDIGIRLCMGDFSAYPQTWEIEENYKRMISDSMNLIREGGLQATEYATYIHGGSKIPDEVIGTVSSISLNSDIVDRRKPLIGLADAGNGKVKVSARLARDINNLNLNLRDIISKAATAVDGEGGGHRYAAGALIDKGKEQEFISAVEMSIKGAIDANN
jgi:RecJ-like exonuclease